MRLEQDLSLQRPDRSFETDAQRRRLRFARVHPAGRRSNPTLDIIMRSSSRFLMLAIVGALAAACASPHVTMLNASPSFYATPEQDRPVYPAALRGTGISGVVLAHIVVEASGEIREVRIIKSPHEAFSAEVIAKLKRWKYQPYAHAFVAEYEFTFKG